MNCHQYFAFVALMVVITATDLHAKVYIMEDSGVDSVNYVYSTTAYHQDERVNKVENRSLELSKKDLLGKWKHVGTTVTLTSRKMSKPHKPQVWHFRPSGVVLFTIGKITNSFPYVIKGNEIITEPFRNEKRSFYVVRISRSRMIWKDPLWDSYVHVVRID